METPQSSASEAQSPSEEPGTLKQPRVIIVGAGIAGLVAAQKLQSSGRFEVVVLEGSDRVGGRVHTSSFRGKRVELGAQWIHGIKGSPVYALAKEAGLMESDDAPEESEEEDSEDEEEFDFDEMLADISVTRTETGGVVNKALRREVGRFYRRLHKEAETEGSFQQGGVESVGEYLDQGFEEWLQEKQDEKETGAENTGTEEGTAGGGDCGKFLTQAPKRGLGPEVAGSAVSSSDASADAAFLQERNAASKTPEELRALKRAVFEMRKRLECNIAGTADLALLSLEAYPDYWEFPGPQLQIPKGYSGVAEALFRKLLPGTVRFNQTVKCIKWGLRGSSEDPESSAGLTTEILSDGSSKGLEDFVDLGLSTERRVEGGGKPVRVECENGDQLTADHVITTVSLGVLKERAAGALPCDAFSEHSVEGETELKERSVDASRRANADRGLQPGSEEGCEEESGSSWGFHPSTALFDPPLPIEKQAAIQRMGFGLVDKVFVEFEKQPLPRGCGSLELAWVSDDPGSQPSLPHWVRGLFSFGTPNGLPKSLMCWLHGSHALQMERLLKATIMRDVVDMLERFQGNKPTPATADVAHSSWGTDPLFRGSYSYVAVGSSEKDIHELARPLPYVESLGALHAEDFKEGLLRGRKATSAVRKDQKSIGERGKSESEEAVVFKPSVGALQILFAGEATHPHYYSTTHGAWLSGLREAERITLGYDGEVFS